jgi:hypothetical protein
MRRCTFFFCEATLSPGKVSGHKEHEEDTKDTTVALEKKFTQVILALTSNILPLLSPTVLHRLFRESCNIIIIA